MKRFVRFASLLLAGPFIAGAARADEPTTQPTTQPATTPPPTTPTTEPTTQPASISSAAQTLLDQITAAYAKPNAIEFTGDFTFDADVAGDQDKHQLTFTSQFNSPNQFRHELKGEVLIVSTGDKLHVYMPERNHYLTFDSPKTHSLEDVDDSVRDVLDEQDPALLWAISGDAGKAIADGAQSIEKSADADLDHATYNVLDVKREDRALKLLIDQKTGLVRQIQIDLRPTLEKAGVPKVVKAMTTIDYSKTNLDDQIGKSTADWAKATFAWDPPKGAILVKADSHDEAAGGGGGAGDDEASAKLVGKPAPAFKLDGADGKSVALADLKGRVVVLDFWATWCPPCRESLPHLNEFMKSKANEPVSVFAVNLRETKDKAASYMTDNKLDLNVLLDTDGKVAEKYLVTGIPQTVIIDKQGNVRKIIVGFEPGVEKTIAAAVAEASK